MSIFGWIILGGLAGWIASLVMTSKGKGLIGNIAVGIVGAFIGGFVFSALGGEGVTGFNVWSFAVAIVGAVILLWLVRLIKGGDAKKA